MALRKDVNLRNYGENVLGEDRHTKDGKWIHVLVFRKDDFSRVSVNETLVKVFICKKGNLWKLRTLKTEKDYKKRIDAETEAVRLVIEKIYEVLNEEGKEFNCAKWKKTESGYRKQFLNRTLELKEQKADGEAFGYKFYVDGEEFASPLELGDRGKKAADKIYIWERVYGEIGKITEEWEFEEWFAGERGKK